MARPITRILSDLHYGDRASWVKDLGSLAPLLEGADWVVINGDLLDTRPGPNPAATRQTHADALAFLAGTGKPVTFVTGNHDPDISGTHSLDLEDGKVFLTHGDILFEDIVPWGRDRQEIVDLLAQAFAAFPAGHAPTMEERLAVYRAVAAVIPQRHQAETRPLRYLYRFAMDTVWPPSRVLTILRAWRQTPGLGAEFGHRHRPNATFALYGHTHRPGIWQAEGRPTVINTGSFTGPLGGRIVDLDGESLSVRKIISGREGFRPGAEVARFSLA